MELTVYWCLLFSGRFQENATDKYQIYHRNIPLKYHRFQQMSCPLSVRPAVEPLIGYFVLIPQLDKKSCWSGVVSVVFRLETRRPWNPLIEKLLLLVCPSLKNDYIGLQWFISLYHVYACLSSFWSYSIDNFGGSMSHLQRHHQEHRHLPSGHAGWFLWGAIFQADGWGIFWGPKQTWWLHRINYCNPMTKIQNIYYTIHIYTEYHMYHMYHWVAKETLKQKIENWLP